MAHARNQSSSTNTKADRNNRAMIWTAVAIVIFATIAYLAYDAHRENTLDGTIETYGTTADTTGTTTGTATSTTGTGENPAP